MSRNPYRRFAGATGFTLVELAITVTVLAIVCAIAFPSFTGLLRSNRLSGTANEMVVAFQTARSEAIKLNGSVSLCRSDNGLACATGDAWSALAIVDRDGTLLRSFKLNPGVEVNGDAALDGMSDTITFSSDGIARDTAGAPVAATLSICMPVTNPSDNIRNVTIMGGSRISISRATGNGACSGT